MTSAAISVACFGVFFHVCSRVTQRDFLKQRFDGTGLGGLQILGGSILILPLPNATTTTPPNGC